MAEQGRETDRARLYGSEERVAREQAAGRDPSREFHARRRADAIRRALANQIDALDLAVGRNGEAVSGFAEQVGTHLHALRVHFDQARQRLDAPQPGANRSAPCPG